MKDFKTLQSEHEALLALQGRLNGRATAQKTDQALLDELQKKRLALQQERDALAQDPLQPQPLSEGPPGIPGVPQDVPEEGLGEVDGVLKQINPKQAEFERFKQEKAILESDQAQTTARIQASQEETRRMADELVTSASCYIQEAKTASAKIGSAREREQLRANLRYWGSFLYEKTASYPNTDLAPAALSLRSGWGLWLGLAVGVVILVLLYMALSFQLLGPGKPTPTAQSAVIATPSPASFTPKPPTQTAISLPSVLTPSITVSLVPVVPTLTPVLSLAVSLTPGPDLGILVSLSSPADGQPVSPAVTFSGRYANLQPGWTIHVLLQPKTKPGLGYYPIQGYFTVPDGEPSGNWKLDGHFGSGIELEKAEQYNIKVVVVTDAPARTVVDQATVSGLVTFPSGVIAFPKVTNVSRAAYHAINEPRLLYTSIDRSEGSSTIVTANLDGRDVRPLAHTPDLAESFPALSPDGAKIAFVAVRRDAKNNPLYAIGIMESNGDNQKFFFEKADWVYEEPVWSQDGNTLAFSATDRSPFPNGGSTWTIFLADARAMLSGAKPPEPRALTASQSVALGTLSNRYPEWLDNTTVIYSQLTVNSQIFFRVNINTLDTRVFYDLYAWPVQIALSPDHKIAALILPDDVGPQVTLVYLDPGRASRQRVPLTTNATPKQFPRWDPSGQVIYFELDQTANSSLWAVNADGSGLRQITIGLRASEIQPFVGQMNAYFPIGN